MNRQKMTAAGALLGTMLLLMPIAAYAGPVSQADAEAAALSHAGVTREEVAYLYTKEDHDDGRRVYEVEFITQGDLQYDYEILSEDGSILSVSCDRESLVYQNRAGQRRNRTGQEDQTGQKGSQTEQPVSLQRASEIALEHAGLRQDQVTFGKQQADHDDGQKIYEISFFTEGGQKYEYDVEAATGEILKWELDQKAGPGKKAVNADHGIQAAKDAALAQADLREEDVRWGRLKFDHDDGRSVYEGSFYSGDREYEFEYDLESGRLTDWDVESIYD